MNFQTTAVFDFQMARSPPFPNKMEPVLTALLSTHLLSGSVAAIEREY